jgi:hypothetical protein
MDLRCLIELLSSSLLHYVQPLSQADAVPISSDDMSSSSLTLRSDGEDDNAEVAGAYGDVFSKSIEKLKDASSVSLIFHLILVILAVQI